MKRREIKAKKAEKRRSMKLGTTLLKILGIGIISGVCLTCGTEKAMEKITKKNNSDDDLEKEEETL